MMPGTNSEAPRFKGLRQDRAPSDCTIDQILTLFECPIQVLFDKVNTLSLERAPFSINYFVGKGLKKGFGVAKGIGSGLKKGVKGEEKKEEKK
jgi:hypothetical protein